MLEYLITQFSFLSLYTMIYTIFWFFVFIGVFFNIDAVFFFGFLIWCLMLLPIYKRFDIFMEGQKIILIPTFKISLLFLTIFLILFVICVLKMFNAFSNTKDRLEKFPKIQENLNKYLNNFSKLWKLPIDLFVNVVIFRVDFIHDFVKALTKNLTENLNTEKKKLVFFSLTIFIPRIIILFSIFYDIYIEKQLLWSPILSLLLILTFLTRISFLILEHYCNECLADIATYVYFEIEPVTEEERKLIVEKVGEKSNLSKAHLVFRCPIKEGFDTISHSFFFTEIVRYSTFQNWFSQTKKLLDNINLKIFLLWLILQIIFQISNICYYLL